MFCFQPTRSEVPATEHSDGCNIWWSVDQCLQVRTYLSSPSSSSSSYSAALLMCFSGWVFYICD